MTNTKSPRTMTATERDRLARAFAQVETATNFTRSSEALKRLNEMQDRLMSKGVTPEEITAVGQSVRGF